MNEYSNRDNLKGINSIASYTGRVFVLNIINPHAKVIIEESRMSAEEGASIVYFVRDVMNVGQTHIWLQNYVQIRDGKWLENNPLPLEEYESFKKFHIQSIEDKGAKIAPPTELTAWHQNYQLRVDYDVYEAESWVKFALSNSIADGMKDDEAKLYRLALSALLTEDHQTAPKSYFLREGTCYEVRAIELNEVAIVYIIAQFSNFLKPIYLLLGGGNVRTQEAHWHEITQRPSSIEQNIKNLEDIQRVSLRAYPQWAVNNPDLWKSIQKNSETGNLSLLPEQTNFLKGFSFPKYINGQAGSGKSTMLYYLFANAYFYKCFGEIKGDIIFLTENEELLKHTKKSVVELLQCNPEFELSLEDIANVDTHFISFKNFLLDLLSEEDRVLFPTELYLDFSRFKNLYEVSQIANHIKRKYSPEYVWFAITTYIYGYDLDFQITTENYEERMPSEGRGLLSMDDLQSIETYILPFYRKLITEFAYWDKINIISFIKRFVNLSKQYSIIFCDEAQDFSRVELRFILSQSEYLKYDLSTTTQVPVVFAGDALQTVNPTGFRSAEVKDMLYQELKEIANFKLDTNNIEYSPNYNYRSSQPIVNVANAIQYYRKKHFGADIKKPQIAKRPELGRDAHLNIFLSFDEISNDADLHRKLEYKTFIIPTNSDEKEEYIDQHPFLRSFPNVKTSVEAKGIDYEQVVLFGFGEYSFSIVGKDEYEGRFFYNKLYVAVTRAQYELIIIDQKESEGVFWRALIDFYANSTWHQDSEVAESEIRDTIVFGAGQIPNVIQSTPEMAISNAYKDKKQGVTDKNPALLRVAANQFLRLGLKNEHYICLALMSRYQENWQEAANYFLKKEVGTQGLIDAANAYWDGRMIPQFISLSSSLRTDDLNLKLILAKFVDRGEITNSEFRALYDRRKDLSYILSTCNWRSEILNTLLSFFNDSASEELLRPSIDIFEELEGPSNRELWISVARKCFSYRRYDDTIEVLEKINDDGLLYIKAQSESHRRKGNHKLYIFWLGRLIKETDELLEKEAAMDEVVEVFREFGSVKELGPELGNDLIIYFSTLFRCTTEPSLIKMARKIEQKYFENNSMRELARVYFEQLALAQSDPIVFGYLLNRWAKSAYESGLDIDVINDAYRMTANNMHCDFAPFSIAEIENIPDLPKSIVPEFPHHIQNIEIFNFRKFDHVVINNLSLFNLVVGDNNIGKTSLLESLLFTPEPREYLQRLGFCYIERRNIQPDKDENSESSRHTFKLDQRILRDFVNYRYDSFAPQFHISQERSNWKYSLIDSGTSSDRIPSNVQRVSLGEIDYKVLSELNFLDGIKQPFMPYGKGFGVDLAKIYFDEIGTKPRIEIDFIENMKLFIPSINRIITDTKVGAIEIYDLDFPDEFRPLHHYGEGANKLFRILILLALHKGERIMVDEIDSGIHYSRFKDFWKIILKVANQDNTQIIATTHNDEFINFYRLALSELGEEFQSKSRVIQMKYVSNSLKIRSYEYHDFGPALEGDFELRGGK